MPEDLCPAQSEPRPSTLPFDPAELTAIRVKPAEFARITGVSRQTVSTWIKVGKVKLFPDGTLDPAIAARSVIENTNPARLRARVFKFATASLDELRARVRDLEAKLADLNEIEAHRTQALENRFTDELGAIEADVISAILSGFDAILAAHVDGKGERELCRLLGPIFHPTLSPDDCDPDCATTDDLHSDTEPDLLSGLSGV